MTDLHHAWKDYGKELLDQLERLTKEIEAKCSPADKLTLGEYYESIQLISKLRSGIKSGALPDFKVAPQFHPRSHGHH